MTARLIALGLLLTWSAAGQNECDLNGDDATNVADVQLAVNQALGITTCGAADLSQDGVCNIVDVQRFVNASLGGECVVDPPAAGYVTYNPAVNPNQMNWNSTAQRWEIAVQTDGTIWWHANRGEGERYTVPIYPGDTAEILGVFAANMDGSLLTPTPWAFTFGMVIIMDSQNESNWEMAAIGNRPVASPLNITVEHKRTVGDQSNQDDVGDIGQTQADIRASVNPDGTLAWEYRPLGGSYQILDPISWEAPRINCSNGCNVIIGAYAFETGGLPFIGGAQGVTVQ